MPVTIAEPRPVPIAQNGKRNGTRPNTREANSGAAHPADREVQKARARAAKQQAQVTGPALAGGAIVSVDPDAAAFRVDLAGAVRAHSPARAVAQFLRAAHRAHVPGDGQRALAAHPAAEQGRLGLLLRAGEQRAGHAGRLDPGAEPAVGGGGAQHPLQPVGHAGAQARMDRNW